MEKQKRISATSISLSINIPLKGKNISKSGLEKSFLDQNAIENWIYAFMFFLFVFLSGQ